MRNLGVLFWTDVVGAYPVVNRFSGQCHVTLNLSLHWHTDPFVAVLRVPADIQWKYTDTLFRTRDICLVPLG